MIHQESHDGFGNGIVNVLFYHIEIRSDQPFDHLGLSLFTKLRIVSDFNDCGHTGKFVAR